MSSWARKSGAITPDGSNTYEGTNTFNKAVTVNGAATFTSALSIVNQTSTGTVTTAGVKKAIRVVTVSGAVAVSALDHIVVINKAFAEATTVSLPAGATGQEFIIKDGSGTAGSTNTITVSAGAIDSSATYVIGSNWNSATLVYNGTKFNVI